MAPVQQVPLVQPLEQPPDALDVVVAERDVRVLVVQPVADPVGELLPFGLVLEDALPGAGVELLHAEPLDVLLAGELELLLDLDLDRQAVGIPPGDAGHRLALHRVEPADQILDRAGEDVMDAGPAVRGGRALEEHEGRPLRRASIVWRKRSFRLP